MAETLKAFAYESGITVYSFLQNEAGSYFDPADNTFKAFVLATTHDLVMAADANQTQLYSVSVTTTNFPTTRNKMEWIIYKQAGLNPAPATDTILGRKTLVWDGTAFIEDPAKAIWDAKRDAFKIAGTFGEQPSMHVVITDWAWSTTGQPLSYTMKFYDTAANALANGATGKLYEVKLSNISYVSGFPTADAIIRRTT